MSAMPSPDKNEPSTITGNRFVGGITQGTNSLNLHAVLYSTADKDMVYFVKHVPLFRS